MTRSAQLLVAALLFALAACASTPAQDGERRYRDRSLLTHEELNAIGYRDAYHAVETLRSHWLRPRGVDSPTTPGQVYVYLNNARLGGVETLRALSTVEITYIRFYGPAAAGARWGRDLTHGVIFVSTERN
jgi:hypothetical protein